MKKLFYTLILLPLSILMSCQDDNISPVDMTLTLSGVSVSNNKFYTVAGENVTIDNLTVKAVDGKNTNLANVVFDLNGAVILRNPADENFGSFSTESFAEGTYSLNVSGNLLQVDSSIQIFAVTYPLTVVESAEDLPTDAVDLGTYSMTLRITDK